mmetsp:Transcript_92313/g.211312  ORF Transcript_92313/g.211312 Transcript_92313/m.211312 type:complete len:195 (+) Transcript_92313:3878-4462(+)
MDDDFDPRDAVTAETGLEDPGSGVHPNDEFEIFFEDEEPMDELPPDHLEDYGEEYGDAGEYHDDGGAAGYDEGYHEGEEGYEGGAVYIDEYGNEQYDPGYEDAAAEGEYVDGVEYMEQDGEFPAEYQEAQYEEQEYPEDDPEAEVWDPNAEDEEEEGDEAEGEIYIDNSMIDQLGDEGEWGDHPDYDPNAVQDM